MLSPPIYSNQALRNDETDSENSKGLRCQPHSCQVYVTEASSNLVISENENHHHQKQFLTSIVFSGLLS